MSVSPLAGQPPDRSSLIDPDALVAAYYDAAPDPAVPEQRVSFGTSGHRGRSAAHTFNEAHVLAISEAVCRYRSSQGIDGPLFLGRDTHRLSEPATRSILEVLAAHDVAVTIDADDGYTPTPVISHAILTHNRGAGEGTADGIVVTPSHNPPEDGGFKYNPPHGGPAGTEVTAWIQREANELLDAGLEGVQRIPYEQALGRALRRDYVSGYVEDLPAVVDLDAIRASGLRLGVDPLGGSSAAYWAAIAERHDLDLTIVNEEVDPTFSFVPVDWDGKIRMDCSSPYAMARPDRPQGPLRRRLRQRPRRGPARHRHAERRPAEPESPPGGLRRRTCSAATATGPRTPGWARRWSAAASSTASPPASGAGWSRCRSASSGSSTGCSTARWGSAARRAPAPRSCAATARPGRPTRTG